MIFEYTGWDDYVRRNPSTKLKTIPGKHDGNAKLCDKCNRGGYRGVMTISNEKWNELKQILSIMEKTNCGFLLKRWINSIEKTQ